MKVSQNQIDQLLLNLQSNSYSLWNIVPEITLSKTQYEDLSKILQTLFHTLKDVKLS